MTPALYRPTVARIDLGRLAGNFAAIRRSLTGRARVLAVVKADAYGHGAREVARTLERAGATAFGVALVEEGIELRKAGIRGEILALGGLHPRAAGAVIEHDLVPALFDLAVARALDRAARRRRVRARVHLKIDTGMARLGVPVAALARFLDDLRGLSALDVAGVFTTLAAGDDAVTTRAQLERFREAVAAIRLRLGRARLTLHAANSAALGAGSRAAFDLVRPGLALYGLGSGRLARSVRPVLSLETAILQLKTLPKGAAVGYRGTHLCARETRLATLPIGYDDGLPRVLGNRGHVLVAGRRVPILGAVSMDLVTVDVSEVPEAAVGDRVVVLGEMGRDCIGAEEIAGHAGTIPYEILCGIGPRVPRLFVSGGRRLAIRSRFA